MWVSGGDKNIYNCHSFKIPSGHEFKICNYPPVEQQQLNFCMQVIKKKQTKKTRRKDKRMQVLTLHPTKETLRYQALNNYNWNTGPDRNTLLFCSWE